MIVSSSLIFLSLTSASVMSQLLKVKQHTINTVIKKAFIRSVFFVQYMLYTAADEENYCCMELIFQIQCWMSFGSSFYSQLQCECNNKNQHKIYVTYWWRKPYFHFH